MPLKNCINLGTSKFQNRMRKRNKFTSRITISKKRWDYLQSKQLWDALLSNINSNAPARICIECGSGVIHTELNTWILKRLSFLIWLDGINNRRSVGGWAKFLYTSFILKCDYTLWRKTCEVTKSLIIRRRGRITSCIEKTKKVCSQEIPCLT